MKSKLTIIFSPIWSEEQLAFAKVCLLKGLVEIDKKFHLGEPLNGISDCDVNSHMSLENSDIEIIVNADRKKATEAIASGFQYERSAILYVGEISASGGHWLLQDGMFHSGLVQPLIDRLHLAAEETRTRVVLATMAPGDDWMVLDRSISVCYYGTCDSDGDSSEHVVIGIDELVNKAVSLVTVTAVHDADKTETSGTLRSRKPALFVVQDNGSSVAPALLALDGFWLQLNCGYGRCPSLRGLVRLSGGLDVLLLTHFSCSNAPWPTGFPPAHVLLPTDCGGCLRATDRSSLTPPNPLLVDLRDLLGTALVSSQHSVLALKAAKPGTTIPASSLRMIQLFHKIGYGKLELVPLCPFEEDPDLKRLAEDCKKGKFPGDGSNKSVASSAAILLLWKPHNSAKEAVKRVLYVGSRCSVKKFFPSIVPVLLAKEDCLRYADTISGENVAKKQTAPKKPVPVAASPSPAAGKPVTTKPAANENAGSKKAPSRPATATVTSATHSTSKDAPAKRPQTASATKGKSEPGKQPTEKKPTANPPKADVPIATTGSKKPQPVKTKVEPKDSKKAAGSNKSQATKPATAPSQANKVSQQQKPAPPQQQSATQPQEPVPPASLTNGDAALSNGSCHGNENIDADHGQDQAPSATNDNSGCDGSKIVAVGTVECAITEHGEADFCDDTPEELSADQMRKMGLYEDEEEQQGAGGDSNGASSNGEHRVGNLAHLPMEGSFYGKEPIDGCMNNDGIDQHDWQQPLSMPVPMATKDSGRKSGGKSSGCVTPIFVDFLCVPVERGDGADLACLLETVRAAVIVAQLDQPGELVRITTALLEEREKDVTLSPATVSIVPAGAGGAAATSDDLCADWMQKNAARLLAAGVAIDIDLSRRSLSAVGDDGRPTDACHCAKFEL